MKKKPSKLALFTALWLLASLSLGAILTAAISFFPAINNYKDYGIINLIQYEFPYLFRTMYTLFFLSFLLGLPAFFITCFIKSRFQKRKTLLIILINALLLLIYCYCLEKNRVLISGSSLIMYPAYLLSFILFIFLIFRPIRNKTPHIQEENNI
jgi:hypothetical protein